MIELVTRPDVYKNTYPVFVCSAECPFFIYACDFSPRAVDIVKSHPLYTPENIVAFTLDITTDPSLAFTNTPLKPGTADIARLQTLTTRKRAYNTLPDTLRVNNYQPRAAWSESAQS